MSTSSLAHLLYGDHRAGRRVADLIRQKLGVRILLWDKPCPPGWRPHNTARAKPRARREDLAPTGTD